MMNTKNEYITEEIRTFPSGKVVHLKDGLIHNDTGPAVIDSDGQEYYYIQNLEMSYHEWLSETTNKKLLKVTISGSSGSGKTSLAHYIQMMLLNSGICVNNEDEDSNQVITENMKNEMINRFIKNNHILIETFRTRSQ